MTNEARTAVDGDIVARRYRSAVARLDELWRSDPGLGTASFLNDRFERLRGSIELTPFRLAILRSHTVEPLIPFLRAEAFRAGIDLNVHLGEFNVWAQELYDSSGALDAFQPDAVILALDEPEPEAVGSALAAFRSRSGASFVVHNRCLPSTPALGVADGQLEESEREATLELNRRLRATVQAVGGAYILDYDALVARTGADAWRDPHKWESVRLPAAQKNLTRIVSEWMRFLHPLCGKSAKCAVVDLDNTLWGGIVGEDGFDGIKMGETVPGVFHTRLQQTLLDLTRRGVLLAICSKNNWDDANHILEEHPGMMLRPEHFAALRINWQDKAANLKEIAEELNIGIDSLAFIDDNPVERANIRLKLPEVAVIDLPASAEGYARAVWDAPVFERLQLSAEDCRRSQMYAAQRRRAEEQHNSGTIEEFLHSLDQHVSIAHVSPLTLQRTAQLTQKTNQCNVTTRRYTPQQLEALVASGEHEILTASVSDRFGDNGLTGVALLKWADAECEIDSFLFSCRVIGRSIESAVLAYIESTARSRGCRVLRGTFIPTKKNGPAKDIFSSHGFRQTGTDGEASVWERDLDALSPLEYPQWIQVEIAGEGVENGLQAPEKESLHS